MIRDPEARNIHAYVTKNIASCKTRYLENFVTNKILFKTISKKLLKIRFLFKYLQLTVFKGWESPRRYVTIIMERNIAAPTAVE